MKIAKLDYLSTNESQICKIGQSFKEIIYIAHINEGFSVVLEDIHGKLISTLNSGSWIGCIEYAKKGILMKHKSLEKLIFEGKIELVWQVSAMLREDKHYIENQATLGKKHKPDESCCILDDSKLKLNDIMDSDDTMKELKFFIRNKKRGCIIYRFNIEVSF